jgi:purine-nucleoside phosphorylase
MTISLFDRAVTSARFIREKISTDIDVAVVLGTGLGAFAETLSHPTIIPYEEIPDFARSTVEGHLGRMVIGNLPGTSIKVAVMQGRFHYYEGYSLEEVTLPIRAFGALDVKKLVLTNAAGGINLTYKTGEFMLISDHINFMMASPLRGTHDQRLGDRFPDMTEVYSREYRRIAREVALELGINIHEGIYMALQGPNYETPAEIMMMRKLGADAVGMSTVPEAIVARQMEMQTLGISLITNPAAGIENGPLEHDQVMQIGLQVNKQFCQLLTGIISRL